MNHGPYIVGSSREVYSNPWIQVREDIVKNEAGKDGLFGIVTMVPGATVLPVTEQGDVYLVEEYKYAVDRVTLEAISGGIEPDEAPIEAVRRELKEETGLSATEMISLGVTDPFTTVIHSPNYIFLARGLSEGSVATDEWEKIKLVRMPFVEAVEKVMNGGITHAASCIAILKAARILDNHGSH